MSSDDSDRQRRLAEALRANLRRRKGQARGRTGPTETGSADSDTSRIRDTTKPDA